MLVYYFVPFIVNNRYLLFWVSNGHNSVTVQNRTHVYMNFFDHKDLGNHLLQLCPKVVKFHSIPLHRILFCSVLLCRRSKGSKRANQYSCAVCRFSLFGRDPLHIGKWLCRRHARWTVWWVLCCRKWETSSTHTPAATAGARAPLYPLNRNLGRRQSWSGRFAEGKNSFFFARNRTLDRPVPGLDILPATVFCEVGI